jgi:hypothetical protein
VRNAAVRARRPPTAADYRRRRIADANCREPNPMSVRNNPTCESKFAGDFNFWTTARLRPGVPPGKAQSELNVVQAAIGKQIPGDLDLHASLIRCRSAWSVTSARVSSC